MAFGALTLLAQIEVRPATGICRRRIHAALQAAGTASGRCCSAITATATSSMRPRRPASPARRTNCYATSSTFCARQSPRFTMCGEAKKDAIWVKPSTVIEARFAAWTTTIWSVRPPPRLREDKDPKEVVREMAGPYPNRQEDARAKRNPHQSRASSRSRRNRGQSRNADPIQIPQRSRAVAGVSISHPDKILDEESHLTKLQLAEVLRRRRRSSAAAHRRPAAEHRALPGRQRPALLLPETNWEGMPAGVDSVPVW